MKPKLVSLFLMILFLVGAPLTATASSQTWKRLKQLHPKSEEYHDGYVGCGRVFVKATPSDTKKTVLDFNRYPQMMNTFKKARVVNKTSEYTDVYVEVPILGGKATVKATVRFDKMRQSGKDSWVMKGRMVEGNVKRFNATYKLFRVDGDNTQLDLQMDIKPKFPVPRRLVRNETSSAAAFAVKQMRWHAEHDHG